MNNVTIIKKLKGVQSDKVILDILCEYLDDDIVEEIKSRRIVKKVTFAGIKIFEYSRRRPYNE